MNPADFIFIELWYSTVQKDMFTSGEITQLQRTAGNASRQ